MTNIIKEYLNSVLNRSHCGRRSSVRVRGGPKTLTWRKIRFEELEERQLLALAALSIDGIDFVGEELTGALIGSGWSYLADFNGSDYLVLNGYNSRMDTISATGDLTILVSGAQNSIHVGSDENAIAVHGNLTIIGAAYSDENEQIPSTAADNQLSLSGGLYVSGALNIAPNEPITLLLGERTVRYFVDSAEELNGAFAAAATDADDITVLIHGDIELASTVTAEAGAHVTLVSSGNHTISKGADFDSSTSMFVITGKNAQKTASVQFGLQSGMGTSTLTVDGGAVWTKISAGANAGVVSTCAMINVVGTMRMYDGVILQNAHNSTAADADSACGAVFVNNTKTNFYLSNPKTPETEANGNRGGIFEMYGGTITQCYAYRGGGVGVTGRFTLDGGLITECYAYVEGGGVRSRGMFVFESGTISYCGCVSQEPSTGNDFSRGGGVHNSKYGYMRMSGGTIEHCYSVSHGGGIYVGGIGLAYTFLDGGRIENNRAFLGGGVAANSTLYLSNGLYVGYNDTYTLNADGSLANVQKSNAHGEGLYVFYQAAQLQQGGLLPNIHVKGGVKIDLSNDVYIAKLMFDSGSNYYPTIPIRVDGELTESGPCMMISGSGTDYSYKADYEKDSALRFTPIVMFTESYYRDYAANHGVADWRTIDPLFADVYAWRSGGFLPGSSYEWTVSDGSASITGTVQADANGMIDLSWSPFEGETIRTKYRIQMKGHSEQYEVSYRQAGYYDLYNIDMPISQSSKFAMVSTDWELTPGLRLSVEGVNVNAYNRTELDKTVRQLDTPDTLCLFDTRNRLKYQARVGNVFFATVDQAFDYVAIHADQYSGHDYDESGKDGVIGTEDDLAPAVIYAYHNSTLTCSHLIDCDVVFVSATDESFQSARYEFEQDFLWEHYSRYDANGDGFLTVGEIPDDIINSINLLYPEYQWYKNYYFYRDTLDISAAAPLTVTTVVGADGETYRLRTLSGNFTFTTAAAFGAGEHTWAVQAENGRSAAGGAVTLAEAGAIEFSWDNMGWEAYLLYVDGVYLGRVTPSPNAPIVDSPSAGICLYDGEFVTGSISSGSWTTPTVHFWTDTRNNIVEKVTLQDGTVSDSYAIFDGMKLAMTEGFFNASRLNFTIPAAGPDEAPALFYVKTETDDAAPNVTETFTQSEAVVVGLPDTFKISDVREGSNPVSDVVVSAKGKSDILGNTTLSVAGDGELVVDASSGTEQYTVRMTEGTVERTNAHYEANGTATDTAQKFMIKKIENILSGNLDLFSPNCYITATMNGKNYQTVSTYKDSNNTTCHYYKPNDDNAARASYQFISCEFDSHRYNASGHSIVSGSFTVQIDFTCMMENVIDKTDQFLFAKTITLTARFSNAKLTYGVPYHIDTNFAGSSLTVVGETEFNGYVVDEATGATADVRIDYNRTKMTRVKFRPGSSTRITYISTTPTVSMTFSGKTYEVDAFTFKTNGGNIVQDISSKPLVLNGRRLIGYNADGSSVYNTVTLKATSLIYKPTDNGTSSLKLEKGTFLWNDTLGEFYSSTGLDAPDLRFYLEIPVTTDFLYTGFESDLSISAMVARQVDAFTVELSGDFTHTLLATFDFTATDYDGYQKTAVPTTAAFHIVNGATMILGGDDDTHVTFDGYFHHALSGSFFLVDGADSTLIMNRSTTIQNMRSKLTPKVEVVEGTRETIYYGAAVTALDGRFVMNGGTLDSNCGYSSGAVAVNIGGTFDFNAGTIQNNDGGASTEKGYVNFYSGAGAIYNYGGTVTVARTDIFDKNGVKIEALIQNNRGKYGGIYNEEVLSLTTNNTIDSLTFSWTSEESVSAGDAFLVFVDGVYLDMATGLSDGTGANGRWTYNAATSEYTYTCADITTEWEHTWKVIADYSLHSYGRGTAVRNEDGTLTLSWTDPAGNSRNIFYNIAIDGESDNQICVASEVDRTFSNARGSWSAALAEDGVSWEYTYTTAAVFDGSDHLFTVSDDRNYFASTVPESEPAGSISFTWDRADGAVRYDVVTTKVVGEIENFRVSIPNVSESAYGTDINTSWQYDAQTGQFLLNHTNGLIPGDDYRVDVQPIFESENGETSGETISGEVTATHGGRLAIYWSDPVSVAHQADIIYYIYVDGIMIHDVRYAETGVNNNSLWTWIDPNDDGLGEYRFLLTNFSEGSHDVRIQIVWPKKVVEEQGTITAAAGAAQGALSVSWEPSSFTYVNHTYDITVNGAVFEKDIPYGTTGSGENGSWVFEDGVFTYTTFSADYSTSGSYLVIVTDNRLGTVFEPDARGEISFSWTQSPDANASTIYQTSIEQKRPDYIPNAETWDQTVWNGNWGTCVYDSATGVYTYTANAGSYTRGYSYGVLVHAVINDVDVNFVVSNPTKVTAETAANVSVTWTGNTDMAADGVIYGMYVTNPNTGDIAFLGEVDAYSDGSNRYGRWTYDAETQTYNFISNVPVFAVETEYHCQITSISAPTPDPVSFTWIDAGETDEDTVYLVTLLYDNEVVDTRVVLHHQPGYYDAQTGYYTITTDFLTLSDQYEWYVTKVTPDYLYDEQEIELAADGVLSFTFSAPDFADADTSLGLYIDGVLQDIIRLGDAPDPGGFVFEENGMWTRVGGEFRYFTNAPYAAGTHTAAISAVVTTDATGHCSITWADSGAIDYKVFLGREFKGVTESTELRDINTVLHPNTTYQWTIGTVEEEIAHGSRETSDTGAFHLIWNEIGSAAEGDYYVVEVNGVIQHICAWHGEDHYNAETGTYTCKIENVPSARFTDYTVRLVKASFEGDYSGVVRSDPSMYLQYSWEADPSETERTLYTLTIDDVTEVTVAAGQSVRTPRGTVTYLNGVYSFKSDANAFAEEFSICRVGVTDQIDPNVAHNLSIAKADLTLYGGVIRNNVNGTYAAKAGTVTADADGNITAEWYGVYGTDGNPFNVIVDRVLIGTLTPRTESVENERTQFGYYSYDAATNKYTYVYDADFAPGSEHSWLVTGYAVVDYVADIQNEYLFQYDTFVKTTTTTVVQYYTDSATKTKIPLESVSTVSIVPSEVRLSARSSTEWSADGMTETITTVCYEEPIRSSIAIFNLGTLTFADPSVDINLNNIVYLGFDNQKVLTTESAGDGPETTEIQNNVRSITVLTDHLDALNRFDPCTLDSFTNAPKTLLVTIDAHGNGEVTGADVAVAAALMEQSAVTHFAGSVIQNAEFDMNVAHDTFLTYSKNNELVMAYGEIKYVNSYPFKETSAVDSATTFQIDTVTSDAFIGGRDMPLARVTETFGQNGALIVSSGTKAVLGTVDNTFQAVWGDVDYADPTTQYAMHVTATGLDGTEYQWTDVIYHRTDVLAADHGQWSFENGLYTYTSENLALGNYVWYVETCVIVSDERTVEVTWQNTDAAAPGTDYYLYVNNRYVDKIAYDPNAIRYTRTVDVAAELTEGEFCNWTVMTCSAGSEQGGAAFTHRVDPITGTKYYFVGWNTKIDGSGTWIYPTSTTLNTIPVSGYDVVYAMWSSNIVNTLNDTSVEIDKASKTAKTTEWLSLRGAMEIAMFNETLKGTDDYDVAKSTIVFELNPELWEQASEWAERFNWTGSGLPFALPGEQYSVKCFPDEMVIVLTLGMLPTINTTLNLDATDLENTAYAHPNGTRLILDGYATGDAADDATKHAAVGFADVTWNKLEGAVSYEIYLDGKLYQTIYTDSAAALATSGVERNYVDVAGTVYKFNSTTGLYTLTVDVPAGESVTWSVTALFADAFAKTVGEVRADGTAHLEWSFHPAGLETAYRVFVGGEYVTTVTGARSCEIDITDYAAGQNFDWHVKPIYEAHSVGTAVSAAQTTWYRQTVSKTVTEYEETYVGGVLSSTQEKNATDGTVTFCWTETALATGYRVYIDGKYVETVNAMPANGTNIVSKGTLKYTDGVYTYKWNTTKTAGERYTFAVVEQMTAHVTSYQKIYKTSVSKSGNVVEQRVVTPSNTADDRTVKVTTSTIGITSTKVTDGNRSQIMKINTGAAGSSKDDPVVIHDIDFRNGGVYNGTGGSGSVNGGAIYVAAFATYVNVEKATFTDNVAYYGGSIMNFGILNVKDCNFETTLTQNNSTVSTGSNFYMAFYGGGIYNAGTLNATNVKIKDMWVSGNGGGIANCSSTYGSNATESLGRLTLSAGRIENCYAIGKGDQQYGFGGGLGNWGEATLCDDTVIINCYASENGGGITNGYYISETYGTTSSMEIISSSIAGNTAAYSGGGIINGSELVLTSTTVQNNEAIARNGGGITNTRYESPEEYLRGSSTKPTNAAQSINPTGSIMATTSSAVWSDTKADGVLTIGSNGTAMTYISGNKSVRGYGGAISHWGKHLILQTGIVITNNEALYGGGIRTYELIENTDQVVGFANPKAGINNSSNRSRGDNNATADISGVTPAINVQTSANFVLVSDASEGSELLINNGSGALQSVSATQPVTATTLGLSQGENTLIMQLRDQDGVMSDPFAVTVTVAEVAPTVSVDKTVCADSRILILDMEVFSDRLPERWVVSWGDGEMSRSDSHSNSLTMSHCYNRAGSYNVILELTDEAGRTTTHLIAVHEVALPASALLPSEEISVTEAGPSALAPNVEAVFAVSGDAVESAFVLNETPDAALLIMPTPALSVAGDAGSLPRSLPRVTVAPPLALCADRFLSLEDEERERARIDLYADPIFADFGRMDAEWSLDFAREQAASNAEETDSIFCGLEL